MLDQACGVLLDSALGTAGMASMWLSFLPWIIPLVHEKVHSEALLSYKTSRGKKIAEGKGFFLNLLNHCSLTSESHCIAVQLAANTPKRVLLYTFFDFESYYFTGQ